MSRSVRPQLLFVAPVTPGEGGNGLAMRAGLFLDGLARDHDVSLLVVPLAGVPPAAWPAFVRARTVERHRIDLAGREDPAFTRPSRSGLVAALRSYPRPTLCRFATDDVLGEAARAFLPSFDVLHVMGLHLAPFLTALGERCRPGATTVLDLNDDEVETRRRMATLHARLGQAASMVLEAAEADKYLTLEREWLCRFDHVLVCSQRDREAIAARVGHGRVHAVPNAVRRPALAAVGAARDGDLPRLLFVGSFGYFPNVDAARVLCREVLPALRERLRRDVAVDLVGSRPGPAVTGLGAVPGVTVHADVPDVASFYARAHATVLPIRAGGGTRVKILEAFAHGVPVISTALGAEGLDVEPGRQLLVAEDAEALATSAARLLAEPGLAARLRAEAMRLIAARYDAAVVAETIRELFRDISSTRA